VRSWAAGHNGVHPVMGGGPVGRLAGDGDDQVVRARHDQVPAEADVADLQGGGHVQAQDGLHPGVFQDAGGHHAPGAACITPWRAFLGRLENKAIHPGQPLFELGKEPGGPQTQAQVDVVAAGVHHPFNLGTPGNRQFFLQGQGVHVGPKGHHPAGARPPKGPRHPVAGNAGFDLQTQVPQIRATTRAVRSS
jgi:hypothetical protein